MSKLKINIKSHFYRFLSVIFIQIFFPPLMLFFWGKENFNLWLFLFAIPGFFTFFHVSITTPVRNQMYKLYKMNVLRDLGKIYANSFLIVLINILIISLISLIYFSFNLKNEFYIQNIDLIFIVFTITFLNLINGNAHTLLTYKGDYSLYLKVEIFFSILNAILIPASFIILSNFKETFFLRLFNEFVKSLVLFYLNRNEKFNIFINFKLINYKDIKHLFKISFGYSFDVLSNMVKGPGIIFLIGLSNLNIIGLISTSRTLFYYLPFRFLDIFISSFYLEFNNLLNNKNLKKKFRYIYLKLLIFLCFILSIHLLITLFLGEYIYSIWLNNKFQFDLELTLLIVADSIFTILGIFFILPFKSIHQNNKPALIELLINIFLFCTLVILDLSSNITSIFKIILTSSIIIFFIKIYFTIKLYKKYASSN